jgi:hypothetical protein
MLSEDRLKRIEAALLADVEFLRQVADEAIGIGGIGFEHGSPAFIETDGSEGVTSKAFPNLATYLRDSKETSVEGGE